MLSIKSLIIEVQYSAQGFIFMEIFRLFYIQLIEWRAKQ